MPTETRAPATDLRRKERILVVDDDLDIREILADVLGRAGYEVEASPNGLDALTRLRSSPADLIVLDLMMPVMDGRAFRAAQQQDTALAPIPVLAISAHGSPKAMGIDAESYLRKPFDLHELLAVIEKTLHARASSRER